MGILVDLEEAILEEQNTGKAWGREAWLKGKQHGSREDVVLSNE